MLLTIPQLFSDAIRHHKAGRLDEAEIIYQRILGINPRHPDSIQFLGVVACQRGQFDRAIELITLAIEIDAKIASYHSNLGNAFKGRGDLPEAISSYQNALQIDRDFLEPTYNLGLSLVLQGEPAAAAAFFQKAAELAPSFIDAHFNHGTTLIALGKSVEAIRSFKRVLELNPNLAEAHFNLGNIQMSLGNHEAATSSYHCAIRLNPHYPEAISNLGNVLMASSKVEDAMGCYQTALDLRPRDPTILSNLGNALMALGQLGAAEECYRAALQFEPDHAEALNNLGNALKDQGKLLDAITCYQQVLTRQPQYSEAHHNLAKAYKDLGRINEAIEHYRTAVSIKPEFLDSHHNLLMAMHHSSECSETEIRDAAIELSRKFERTTQNRLGGIVVPAHRQKLRIGYVSGDFRSHPVGYFLARVLSSHDKEAFEIVCYSNTQITDATTEQLTANVLQWRDISNLSDSEASEVVKNDGIDILVDLSGHTARNRLSLFARKPAPVQATWLGYFGTTGLPEIDYIVADRFVAPAGAEIRFSERILRLPDSYLCFSPPEMGMPIASRLGDDGTSLTLGCFNNLAKVSEGVITAWASILTEMPNCRLFLKTNFLNDPSVQAEIERQFASNGIGSERLILEGPSPREELLQAYNRVDIALDPFPYGGGTTTAEALWMGVPVVTVRGDRWVGRVSESILETIGLPGLVARDLFQYREIVRDLSTNRPYLHSLRESLRPLMERSPFCDGPRFASALEAGYRSMWQTWCAGGAEGNS